MQGEVEADGAHPPNPLAIRHFSKPGDKRAEQRATGPNHPPPRHGPRKHRLPLPQAAQQQLALSQGPSKAETCSRESEDVGQETQDAQRPRPDGSEGAQVGGGLGGRDW